MRLFWISMCIYTNVIKYLWTHQHYKNDDTHFQNNLYSLVIDRQVHPRSFCEVSLEPSCIYVMFCIYFDVAMKCNLCKIITINAIVVVLWLLYYICCDTWHEVLHPRTFPLFSVLGCDTMEPHYNHGMEENKKKLKLFTMWRSYNFDSFKSQSWVLFKLSTN